MRALRHLIGWVVAIGTATAALLLLWAMTKASPRALPWTPLDLAAPVGLATGRKLAALGDNPLQCRTLLDRAGVRYTMLPVRREGAHCGYTDGVRFAAGGARRIGFVPASLGIACPVAAALAVWEWEVVQPAAQRLFGQRVTRIDHYGSFNCRRIYGRDAGTWSEHATADAIDIAGFRLADGTRITIVGDWRGTGNRSAFLKEVRDGACGLFATTLSPDYNAAHRDHLHLDQANRGAMGWRACR